jgi:poly(A) polymerase
LAYKHAKTIRDRLDEVLLSLNVKRSTKEAITTLLVNLSLFELHEKSGWPKWLKKKSYFRECEQFYRIYCEALGGPSAEAEKVMAVAALPDDEPKSGPSRKRTSRRRGRPTLAHKSGGGIFGLRPSVKKRKAEG